MSHLEVQGGQALEGEIIPSANKNAVLPVLCATLLTEAPVTLRNVPDITDVRKILELFRALGSSVEHDLNGRVLRIQHRGLNARPPRLPEGMRAAVLLIPPMLQRLGSAALEDDPKGCTLGAREIDPHVELFRHFGARVGAEPGVITVELSGRFRAVRHWLEYASVTTTENFLLCAAMAAGTSELINAACEPHVQELCAVLALMGARITGQGASRLLVEGVDELGGLDYAFEDDFHEVATFLAVGAATGGRIRVRNGRPDVFGLIDRTFAKFGVEVTHQDGWSSAEVPRGLVVKRPFTAHILAKVEAAPWPYLPVDLLPIFVALGVRAEGETLFWNKVYEGAMAWSTELAKFGAHTLLCDPHRLIAFGGRALAPAEVESPYIIRVAIALFMVAASIEGRSTILNADPIRRAHPAFVENLRTLGARVTWSAS